MAVSWRANVAVSLKVFVGAEQPIERYFDKRRFGSAGTHNRFGQSRGRALGEINTNSGFHMNIPLKRNWSRSLPVHAKQFGIGPFLIDVGQHAGG